MAETILAAVSAAASQAGTISAITGALGLASSIATPLIESRNQAAIAKGQAAQLEQTARDQAVAASIAGERQRRKNRQLLARQEAGAAQAGAFTGTTLDLLDQNSVALEADALTVEFNERNQAAATAQQGANLRAQAADIKSGGRLGALGAGIGGANKLANLSFDPLNSSGPIGPKVGGAAKVKI